MNFFEGGKIANLAELQDKARTLVADWKNGSDHPLIQLVEELCREGERITDEAKKDKEDLRQQVSNIYVLIVAPMNCFPRFFFFFETTVFLTYIVVGIFLNVFRRTCC